VFWKVVFIQLLAFIIALVSYKVIIKITEGWLFKGQYKIKTSYSYLIASIIMLVSGIVFGKEILYSLL